MELIAVTKGSRGTGGSTLLHIAQRHRASYTRDNIQAKKRKETGNSNRKLPETLQKMAPKDPNGRGCRNDIAMSISSSLMEKGCQEQSQRCYDVPEWDNCLITKVFLWFLQWVFWPFPYTLDVAFACVRWEERWNTRIPKKENNFKRQLSSFFNFLFLALRIQGFPLPPLLPNRGM